MVSSYHNCPGWSNYDIVVDGRRYNYSTSPVQSTESTSYFIVKNWNNKKIELMMIGLFKKFEHNNRIKELLIQTNNNILLNNNSDIFWGYDNSKGKNVLGNLLMNLRKFYQYERYTIIHLNYILNNFDEKENK
jgi:hypothetical protein